MVERAFVLADFGSTFTKLSAVEAGSGRLIARSDHPTTVSDDVMVGFRSAFEVLAPFLDKSLNAAGGSASGSANASASGAGDADSRHAGAPVKVETLACSSAGGGLRVAVIGLERDITTEAARRVALNSGGRIVATVSGAINADSTQLLRSSAADVALIVGGTDGGNRDALLERACAVVATLPHAAAVVAGNTSSSAEAASILERAGIETTVVANVLPRIGELVPGPARDAIRDAFISHVIGGKKLSADPAFLDMVIMPTPDAVLRAVELLAAALHQLGSTRPVIVADVGGATTDIYSVASASTEGGDRGFAPVPTLRARRTVEADMGVRWSAPGIVEAAASLGLITEHDERRLAPAAARRSADVWMIPDSGRLDSGHPDSGRPDSGHADSGHPDSGHADSGHPDSDQEGAIDGELAALAVTVALFRHAGTQEMTLARGGMELQREGPDLRGDALLVLTGGVFRAHGGEKVEKLTTASLDNFDRRRHLLPSELEIVVDSEYLLAACGLLATRDAGAALGLLRGALPALFEGEAAT
jgi:hypothetical protein